MASRRLVAASTRFFVCDLQESFRAHILDMDFVLFRARQLVSSARELGVPVIATEQYSRGLGVTCPEVGLDRTQDVVLDKTLFSMVTPEVSKILGTVGNPKTLLEQAAGAPAPEVEEEDNVKPAAVVLFGIEAHVCVLQTCLDLLRSEHDLDVHVVVDATSSQRNLDRRVAFERMKESGAILTTTESVLFELLGDAKAPGFKSVANLMKTDNKREPLSAFL